MTATIGTSYTFQSPFDASAGLDILASTFDGLAKDQNRGYATGRATTVYQQWWTDDVYEHSGAAPATDEIEIKIPKISDQHTSVLIWAYCEVTQDASPPGSGKVTFKSSVAGDSVDITAPTSVGWVPVLASPETLDVDFDGDGMEIINITQSTTGSPAETITIHGILIEYDDLTAISAPDASDTFIRVDADEVAADSALSADLGRQLRTNLVNLEERPRVYLNWGGLANVQYSTGAVSVGMDSWKQRYGRFWMPINPDCEESDDYLLTAHVYGDAGTARIQHGVGETWEGAFGLYSTDFTIGGADTWVKETDLLMSKDNALPGPNPPTPISHIDIDETTNPTVLKALCVFGR